MTYWIASRCGEFRHQHELRADGDPGQDRSIQVDELGFIGVRGLLGALEISRCDLGRTSTPAGSLVQEPDREGDEQGAERAEKQETKYGASEPH